MIWKWKNGNRISFRGFAEEKRAHLNPTTHRTLRCFYELAQWTVDLIENLDIPWEVKIRAGEYTPDFPWWSVSWKKNRRPSAGRRNGNPILKGDRYASPSSRTDHDESDS